MQLLGRFLACIGLLCLMSACDWLQGAAHSFGVNAGTDPTPATNTLQGTAITYPTTAGKIAGWSTFLQGTCTVNQSMISIVDSNKIVSAITTCTNNSWSVFLDISALPVGNSQILVTQLEGSTLYLPASITIQKSNSNCDLLANRQKNAAAGFAGGDGSNANPYVICTAMQLQQTSGVSSSNNYILQNDIDFNNLDTNGDDIVDGTDANYVAGTGWPSVDLDGNGSASVFYGGSFEIRSLTINNSASRAALFGSASGRAIKNLYLSSVNVAGLNAASLVSYSNAVFLIDVHASGQVSASAGLGSAGGLVSQANGLIIRSSFEGTLTGSDQGLGGIIGSGSLGFLAIADCYVNANIVGGQSVGGIAGNLASLDPAVVSNSYTTGSVKGSREVGGIFGSYGTIINSWSNATILGIGSDSYFGGLSGFSANMYNSFYAGNIQIGTSLAMGTLSGALSSNQSGNYYWSGGYCTGGTACQYQGTAVSSLSSFQDASEPPMNTWDFVGSTSDGTEDHWVNMTANFPHVWWQATNSFTPVFSGLGSAASPYIIHTTTDLMNIGGNTRYMDSYFKLTANLDMSGKNFFPIGYRSGWTGSFDGGNFTISNLSFTDTNLNPVGFISSAIYGNLSNITLTNVNFTGTGDVGGGIGRAISSVSKVHVTGGSVSGTSNVGGIVGSFQWGALAKSSSSLNIVDTGSSAGGLIGATSSTNVQDSYSSSSVVGNDRVGGLVGNHSWSVITNSYANSTVSGTTNVGGLIGHKDSDGGNYIQNCFSISNVTGNSSGSDVGPIVGSITDTTNSTGDYTAAAGVNVSNSGTGGVNSVIATTQPTVASFYDPSNAPMTSWDFTATWLSNLGSSALPSLQ